MGTSLESAGALERTDRSLAKEERPPNNGMNLAKSSQTASWAPGRVASMSAPLNAVLGGHGQLGSAKCSKPSWHGERRPRCQTSFRF